MPNVPPSLAAFMALTTTEEELDLIRVALTIAAQDQKKAILFDDVTSVLDELAERVRDKTEGITAPKSLLTALNETLFDEYGLEGDQQTYYNRENSYLDRVLVRKKGIPLTLSIVYMEVARLAGIPLHGVGVPGHFILKMKGLGQDIFVDPFHKGRFLTASECHAMAQARVGPDLRVSPAVLNAVSTASIVVRLLHNLLQIYINAEEFSLALETVERMHFLEPDEPSHLRTRGLLYFNMEQYYLALRDLSSYRSSVTLPASQQQAMDRLIKTLREEVQS